MFGSSVLDVAIGIIFVYLVLSLVCTAVNEWIAGKVNQRGQNLFEGIKNLLNDPKFTGLAQQLYSHGLVDGISQYAADQAKANRLPSYMPADIFSLALLDILSARGVVTSWPDVVALRQKALEDAKVTLSAKPDDTALQQAVSAAQSAFNQATQDAAQVAGVQQKQADAEAAAKKVVNISDLTHWNAASTALQEALMAGRDLAARHPDPLGNIQAAVRALPAGHTQESLLVLIAKTKREGIAVEGQVQRFQTHLEDWYKQAMERVGGWYKRWTQKILLVLAFSIVVFANADTVMIAQRLTKDTALRASLVTAAEDAAKLAPPKAPDQTTGSGPSAVPNPTSDTPDPRLIPVLNQAKSLDLPLGWSLDAKDPRHVPWVVQDPETVVGCFLSKLIGLIISGVAVSLGAPFWFDTLSKFMNLRGSGTPPGETKKSAPQK